MTNPHANEKETDLIPPDDLEDFVNQFITSQMLIEQGKQCKIELLDDIRRKYGRPNADALRYALKLAMLDAGKDKSDLDPSYIVQTYIDYAEPEIEARQAES